MSEPLRTISASTSFYDLCTYSSKMQQSGCHFLQKYCVALISAIALPILALYDFVYNTITLCLSCCVPIQHSLIAPLKNLAQLVCTVVIVPMEVICPGLLTKCFGNRKESSRYIPIHFGVGTLTLRIPLIPVPIEMAALLRRTKETATEEGYFEVYSPDFPSFTTDAFMDGEGSSIDLLGQLTILRYCLYHHHTNNPLPLFPNEKHAMLNSLADDIRALDEHEITCLERTLFLRAREEELSLLEMFKPCLEQKGPENEELMVLNRRLEVHQNSSKIKSSNSCHIEKIWKDIGDLYGSFRQTPGWRDLLRPFLLR